MTYLKSLSLADAQDVYRMLQEIGADENGFHNEVYGQSYERYRAWLTRTEEIQRGIGLPDWMVPESFFWMYDGGTPVGHGRLRHFLNDSLRETGGHIGYAVAASQRGKGYGTALLRLLLLECDKLGITQVQVGANRDNERSNRVILRNGGYLIRQSAVKNFYQIDRSEMKEQLLGT